MMRYMVRHTWSQFTRNGHSPVFRHSVDSKPKWLPLNFGYHGINTHRSNGRVSKKCWLEMSFSLLALRFFILGQLQNRGSPMAFKLSKVERMAQWCVQLTRLTLVCEVIR